MSVAKRLLFAALGPILLIIAACWSYWAYRQYRANLAPIPRNATSVVRIHIDGLIRDIAWNWWWNNGAYRDTTEHRSTIFSLKQWKQPGIRIPANLFLYQVDHVLSDQFPDVYFGSVVVDDPTAFTARLQDDLGMEIHTNHQGTVASSERTLVVIQPKRALFALSLRKPKADLVLLTDVLTSVLQRYGGNVAVSKSDFREIMRDGGQVSARGEHRFSIDFKKGVATFNGRYEMDYMPARLEGTPRFADSNAVSLWVQDNLTAFLSGRQFDIGDHTLQGDSLLSHYKGRAVLEWKGTITQQDTMINYDYDDNFDPVETLEVIDKPVPEIYCSLGADTALIGYLQAQGVLEIPDNTVNRGVLPLFRVGVSALPPDYVQFHTASEPLAPPVPSGQGRDLLYLRVDFNKLLISDFLPVVAPHLQAFDVLELSGKPATDNRAVINGTLRMKNPQLHSLVQLLETYEGR
ncbi:hypothetical protein [Parapedobacter sp. 2B3]|uniref:hypothetical protein n=1 Tax=Parapedobacter sp. 2B3 TaxID=3342381 RepID=UPI0035B58790